MTCYESNMSALSLLYSCDDQSSNDDNNDRISGDDDDGYNQQEQRSLGDDADIDTSFNSQHSVNEMKVKAVASVYDELNIIRQKLHAENERLKKKAFELDEWEKRVKLCIKTEIDKRLLVQKEKYENELIQYKEQLTKLIKDNKRLNDTLQVLRESNEQLKKKLYETEEINEKLKIQIKQTEKRSENLLRLNDINEQKVKDLEKVSLNSYNEKLLTIKKSQNLNECSKSTDTNQSCCRNTSIGEFCLEHNTSSKQISPINNASSSKTSSIASVDCLNFLFNWLCEITQLAMSNEWPLTSSSNELIPSNIEKYSKLLSLLADQSNYYINNSKLTLTYLKLTYLSLIYVECPTNTTTRHLYSCSYRRICEQILKPNQLKHSKITATDNDQGHSKSPCLFNDNEPLIRLYSCLIVLLTCNKIIDLISCYNQIRSDMNDVWYIDLFVSNHGHIALYRWLKPPSHHRRLIFDTIDLLLLLCTDTKSLKIFLKQLSNDTWFHLFSQLAQQCQNSHGTTATSFDLKTIEKLAILFEKLSELDDNKRYFLKYNFIYIFKEWKQKYINDSPFLVLNLKSTLLNLEQGDK